MSDDAQLSSEGLRQIPLFRGFSEAEVASMVRIGEVRQFEPGATVVEQGGRGQRIWILLEGRCEVVKQLSRGKAPPKPLLLTTLEPFSNFGEMSFFHAAAHSATVRAVTKVKLLSIDREAFDRMAIHEPRTVCKLTMNSIDSLAERLRRMDDWVAELTAQGTEQRVPELAKLRATLFDSWTL